jgi:flagellar motor protein MotB
VRSVDFFAFGIVRGLSNPNYGGSPKHSRLRQEPPGAQNERPEGSDDPEGRQKNRRVEVVLNTCK